MLFISTLAGLPRSCGCLRLGLPDQLRRLLGCVNATTAPF